LFDVTLDCIDLSDERLCRKDQFSCGNWLCVHWSALINQKNGYQNARHAAYMYETVDSFITNRKDLIGIRNQTTYQLPKLTNSSNCRTCKSSLFIKCESKSIID
jgi:hypothetical protein